MTLVLTKEKKCVKQGMDVVLATTSRLCPAFDPAETSLYCAETPL